MCSRLKHAHRTWRGEKLKVLACTELSARGWNNGSFASPRELKGLSFKKEPEKEG